MPTSGAELSAPQHAAASRVRLLHDDGRHAQPMTPGGNPVWGQTRMLPPGPVTIGARFRSGPSFWALHIAQGREQRGLLSGASSDRNARHSVWSELEHAHLTASSYSLFVRLLSSVFFGCSQ